MPGGQTQQTQQTTNSQTSPWQEAIPLLKGLISKYTGMSTDLTPEQQRALAQTQKAAGNVQDFSDQGQNIIDRMLRYKTGDQVDMLRQGYGTLQQNLGGLASGAQLNPYDTPGFSDALGTVMGDITGRTKSVYAGSGLRPSGSGSFAGSLGRGLTEGISPLLLNQFNQNRTAQLNAAQQLFSGAGSTATGITAQQQVPYALRQAAFGMMPAVNAMALAPSQARMAAANMGYAQPFQNLAMLLNPALQLGGMGGQQYGTSTGTTTQQGNLFSNILGGLTGGVGLLTTLFSDKRIKDEVEPIGKLNDGQEVVRFRYKGDPAMRIGLLAQSVEKFAPEAVHDVGGVLAVDHRAATERAAEMGRT